VLALGGVKVAAIAAAVLVAIGLVDDVLWVLGGSRG